MSKSLFGKAHTVMAEGGFAAAMGNVNPNDNWQVHFRDTLRGGKFLTTGGWPSCTPRSHRSGLGARGLGRCLDRTRTARSASGTSAAMSTRAWRTSATGPAWR